MSPTLRMSAIGRQYVDEGGRRHRGFTPQIAGTPNRANPNRKLLAMEASERDSGLRLAELLAAFSLAMDLGLGQPMEHVLRSWLIAARLGEHVGLDREKRGSLFYTATLAWAGCVADTPEVATCCGADIAYPSDSYLVDLAGLPMLVFMLRHAGAA